MSTSAQWTEPSGLTHSSAYDIFILVLTVFSLVIMALLVLPLDEATLQVLRTYDNLICLVFLTDFVINLAQSHPRRAYFIDRRGWLDLLGSIPSFGVLRFTALFRLARLSRLARITRLLRGNNKKALIRDVLANRGQYAIFITVLLAIIVLGTSSVLVLQFESRSPDANITTGGDALWWGFVTITTVGYGDQYPVTPLGRLVGVFVMFSGVGIIGALASILSSLLLPSPADEPPTAAEPTGSNLESELTAIRAELAGLRQLLGTGGQDRPPSAGASLDATS
jgi:voltage-gated potassium channel